MNKYIYILGTGICPEKGDLNIKWGKEVRTLQYAELDWRFNQVRMAKECWVKVQAADYFTKQDHGVNATTLGIYTL